MPIVAGSEDSAAWIEGVDEADRGSKSSYSRNLMISLEPKELDPRRDIFADSRIILIRLSCAYMLQDTNMTRCVDVDSACCRDFV